MFIKWNEDEVEEAEVAPAAQPIVKTLKAPREDKLRTSFLKLIFHLGEWVYSTSTATQSSVLTHVHFIWTHNIRSRTQVRSSDAHAVRIPRTIFTANYICCSIFDGSSSSATRALAHTFPNWRCDGKEDLAHKFVVAFVLAARSMHYVQQSMHATRTNTFSSILLLASTIKFIYLSLAHFLRCKQHTRVAGVVVGPVRTLPPTYLQILVMFAKWYAHDFTMFSHAPGSVMCCGYIYSRHCWVRATVNTALAHIHYTNTGNAINDAICSSLGDDCLLLCCYIYEMIVHGTDLAGRTTLYARFVRLYLFRLHGVDMNYDTCSLFRFRCESSSSSILLTIR